MFSNYLSPLHSTPSGLVNSTEEVCEEFNDFFASVFSRERIEDIPTTRNGGGEEDMLGGIDITQEMVTKQLSR